MVAKADYVNLLESLSLSILSSSSVKVGHVDAHTHVDEHEGHELHLRVIRPEDYQATYQQDSCVLDHDSDDDEEEASTFSGYVCGQVAQVLVHVMVLFFHFFQVIFSLVNVFTVELKPMQNIRLSCC